MNDIGVSRLTHASTQHQTMYHTRSNQLGMFSVASQLLFKSAHLNATYKLHGDKCAECVISRCETRPNLVIWTFDDETAKLIRRYRLTPHPVVPSLIERSRMVLSRRVVEKFIHTPDPDTTVICRRLHKTDISRCES